MPERRQTIDISTLSIVRVVGAVVVVWLWLHLWQLLMLVVVAVVVAIGLEPLVEWLGRRRVPRSLAATGLVLLMTLLAVGFLALAGSSLVEQARDVGGRVQEVRHRLEDRLPGFVKTALEQGSETGHDSAPDRDSAEGGSGKGAARNGSRAPADTNPMTPVTPGAVASYAFNAGRLAVDGLIVAVMALILTIYLIIDGRRTYLWLLAYAPPPYRERVHVTAMEAREKIFGYVVGNLATSAFAAITVLVALTLLHVPAALLLALLAGLFDFVPVLGFICSAAPAVLLAMGRSAGVAVAVAAVYAAYHVAENYYIGPKVYGGRLRLSNLAVIIAFAVGAEIGGIIGALLALPVAALYPVVERVWLADYLGRDAVEAHRRLEQRPG